jgi:hypothetical protein
MDIKTAIETIYLNFEKGKDKVIPDEFLIEYQEYSRARVAEIGNSARASNKRNFIILNIQRFYPNEFEIAKQYISSLYSEGCGLKSIGKIIELSPTRVRTLFSILGIEINKGQNVVYKRTKELRSANLKQMYCDRTGWFKTFERKTNKTARGIQGYYFNISKNKYVWLRSTYEYIYAKWLDKQGIEWDVEKETFLLDKTTYRPDFFLYEDSTLTKIVEIKGYWSRGIVKTEELSKKLKINVILIRDIQPYIETNYKKETLLWKSQRLLQKPELSALA